MTSKREDREALIEEAAKAILTASHGEDYGDWEGPLERELYVKRARAALAVFEQAHTPTDDEQEALAITDAEWREFQAIPEQGYSHRHWVDARIGERVMRDRRRPVQGDPGEHGGTIPLYGMLDVWTALYGTSHPEFDEFYAEHGYAETWARILAAVREHRPVQGATTAAREFLKDVLAESDADEAGGGAGWDVEVDARTVLELLDEVPEPQREPSDALRSRIESTLNRYETIYGGMRQMRYIIGDIRKDLAAQSQGEPTALDQRHAGHEHVGPYCMPQAEPTDVQNTVTIPEHLSKRDELGPAIRKVLVDGARAENGKRRGENARRLRAAISEQGGENRG